MFVYHKDNDFLGWTTLECGKEGIKQEGNRLGRKGLSLVCVL